ncbi:MAG: hypothetical protein M1814_005464 [Vezdaea aestivalis]|nr:MAG: hypothetical protein M1814_005464 [Vezdaea aestivalis]
MSLVERVALDEKAVQIWFQNKRQTDKRKSKPLSLSDLQNKHTDSNNSSFQSSSQASLFGNPSMEPSIPLDSSITVSNLPDFSPSTNVKTQEPFSEEDTLVEPEAEDISTAENGPSAITHPAKEVSVTSMSNGGQSLLHQESSVLLGKADDEKHEDEPKRHDNPLESNLIDDRVRSAPPLLQRSSSFRISLSLEGRAEIVEGDEISPPRKRPVMMEGINRSLQRSKSTGSVRDPSTISPTDTDFGRSRDSRNWEFCCDKDQRERLTSSVKFEQSGSATTAIGLLRSRSTYALQSSSHKRNAKPLLSGHAKRAKGEPAPKPKFTRTQSSVATFSSVKSGASKNEKREPGTSGQIADGYDSDKENWLPGTETAPLRTERASLSQPVPGSILKANGQLVTDGSDFGFSVSQDTGLNRRRRPKAVLIHEDTEEAVEEKNVHQLRTGAKSNAMTSRGGEDLDCVKNLLSLKQGDWR